MISFKTLIRNKGSWIALSAVLFLFACNDNNEDVYPRIRAEYFDVNVDIDTIVTHITLDNGKSYPLNEGHTIKSQVNDTTIRCYGYIEIAEDSSFATIHSVYQAHCYPPSAPGTYKPNIFYKNPVDVVSVYKVHNYINAIVKTKISGRYEHAFDFIKDSITINPEDNSKTIHITFFHWKPEQEYEAFSQNAYLSIPLSLEYYKPEEQFDSIQFYVVTYNGIKKYKFSRN